ncbi:MAG: ABC-type microcin C transport system duplicated ATPase subunit YejF, partial [Bacteroidia bacterium]
MTSLLNIKNLSTCIRGEHETITVVDDVCLDIKAGETVGLVGESGSGKSMTALSISGLLPKPDSFIAQGQLLFEGRDMRHLANAEMANLRGNRIGMIFQDPMTALNPVHRIGHQIAEVLLIHKRY